MEITPKKNKNKVLGGQSHTISATLTWDMPERQGLLVLSGCNWIVGHNNWQTGGSISESSNNVPAGTIVVTCMIDLYEGEICPGELKVYIDGSLTYDFNESFSDPFINDQWSPISYNFNTPYYSDFILNCDNLLCNNSMSDPITITPGFMNCDTTNVAVNTLDSTDVITISKTLLINAFQNYNGGDYYSGYDALHNIWIPKQNKNKTSYGYKVYTFYLDQSL